MCCGPLLALLTVYVHASNLRPVVACKRGPIRKPSITPETPWTVAGARQEPLKLTGS